MRDDIFKLRKKYTQPIKKEIVDTSDVLTDEDLRDMEDLRNINKALSTYIDKDKVIKHAIELIDNSPYLAFKNERAKKFISKDKPKINLFINKEAAMSSNEYKHQTKVFDSEAEELAYLSKVLRKELLNPLTDFIHTEIHKDKDLVDFILSKDIFEDYNHDETKLNSILSIITTIFGMTFNSKDPQNVLVEILI